MFVLFFFSVGLNQAVAQYDYTSSKNKEYILKYPVSSVLGDIRTNSLGVSLGLEMVQKNGWSFTQEVGYIFKKPGEKVYKEGNSNDRLNGIRLTSELRKYLFSQNLNPSNGLFLSTEWDNKLTRASYSMEGQHNYTNAYRSSLTLNVGGKVFWNSDKSGRITLELMLGGGVECIVDDPDSYTSEEKLFFPTETFYPWMNLDFKIGYTIGSR